MPICLEIFEILYFPTASRKNLSVFEGEQFFIFSFLMIRYLLNYVIKRIKSSKASQEGTFSRLRSYTEYISRCLEVKDRSHLWC